MSFDGRKCMALNALFLFCFVCCNQQVSFENNNDMGRFAFCNEVYEKLNTRFCFFVVDLRLPMQ